MTAATGSQRHALQLVGLSRSTWHYRGNPRPRVTDPIPQSERAYPSRIDTADREAIAALITAGWVKGVSVDHAFADAWDAGVMLGSRRSWWRVAADIEDQTARPIAPTRRGSTRPPREAPVLEATGPGQVWSWDITDLRSPWRGVCFKAYSIIDIYSRKLVGWRVEDREADHLAVEMFQQAIAREGIPDVVHADSGPAMRSTLLKDYLGELGITQTHNRPRVSNDNPFSESEFRTMKYRPNYPGTFTDLEQARAFMAWYVRWYNAEHKHSGIALFSPGDVHDGTWQQAWARREHTQQAYYEAHPERFRRPPHTPLPPGIVGINLPKNDPEAQPERLHAA